MIREKRETEVTIKIEFDNSSISFGLHRGFEYPVAFDFENSTNSTSTNLISIGRKRLIDDAEASFN